MCDRCEEEQTGRSKRHCQQQAKQFVPLRSSGLSAFAAGLQRLHHGAELAVTA